MSTSGQLLAIIFYMEAFIPNRFGRFLVLIAFSLLIIPKVITQPITDSLYQPIVALPTYEKGTGPKVYIDEGHHNWRSMKSTLIPHSEEMMAGRLTPFASLLKNDGFIVEPIDKVFDRDVLNNCDILVIGSPGGWIYTNGEWKRPEFPVFNTSEIEAILSWVREGGSLLLIAGNYGGSVAASDLAEGFGLFFSDGSALKLKDQDNRIFRDWIHFKKVNNSLRDHPIVRGKNRFERIDSVVTFEGQAFRPAPWNDYIQPLLVFTEPTMLILGVNADCPVEKEPRIRADGLLQGAVLEYGKGRIAVFGEGGMFSAQIVKNTGQKLGMNHPDAIQNAQFILNVIHWLSGDLND
jgi:hypothetical protein